jgi:hypothetical protein
MEAVRYWKYKGGGISPSAPQGEMQFHGQVLARFKILYYLYLDRLQVGKISSFPAMSIHTARDPQVSIIG